MKRLGGAFAAWTVCGLLAAPGTALAQHAGENAVSSADDAFGINIGSESVGIYSEREARGFSPFDAGNARIDGIYYDPVGALSGRLRASTTIRIGTAAQGFPFPAPTGIVDYKFHPFPSEYGNSFSYMSAAFGGYIADWDLRLPVIKGKLALTGGLAAAELIQSSGMSNAGWGYTIRPIARLGSTEIAPFISLSDFYKSRPPALAILSGAELPDFPSGRHLGARHKWMKGGNLNDQYGGTVKSLISRHLSLRAGLFYASAPKKRNFSDIYRLTGPGGAAHHIVIADPRHAIHSTSGEATIVLRLGGQRVTHRIIAGYRARNRLTETGGSICLDYGAAVYGVIDSGADQEPGIPGCVANLDPADKPLLDFSVPVSAGRVRQSALMLGYLGTIEGVGSVNLGIQKARYRAKSFDGRTGELHRSRASPWLYNATLSVNITRSISAYLGTQRGLEDRGVAPESATNRAEQLPATLARQYEGGLRWKFKGGQLVFNLFEITKPYFSYDDAGRFVELGKERHRGFEVSLSGHFGPRLHLVAGAVAMKPRVTGPAVGAGEVGKRPAGTPTVNARVDLNYRTDIFGGLTPTATAKYTGRRAVSSHPLPELGDRQLILPGFATFDLGLRQRFTIGKFPAMFRAVAENVFDKKAWKVAAADAIFPDERRRFTLYVAVDF
jgi:iron complex outermembrane receptor protein